MFIKIVSKLEDLLLMILVHIWSWQAKNNPEAFTSSMREPGDHIKDTYLVQLSCNAEWLDLVFDALKGTPGLDIEVVKNLGHSDVQEESESVS